MLFQEVMALAPRPELVGSCLALYSAKVPNHQFLWSLRKEPCFSAAGVSFPPFSPLKVHRKGKPITVEHLAHVI